MRALGTQRGMSDKATGGGPIPTEMIDPDIDTDTDTDTDTERSNIAGKRQQGAAPEAWSRRKPRLFWD